MKANKKHNALEGIKKEQLKRGVVRRQTRDHHPWICFESNDFIDSERSVQGTP